MTGSVYSVVELIGSSPISWEEAASNAIDEATHSISAQLRIAEVVEQDVLIDGGKIHAYRTKVRLSYKRASDVLARLEKAKQGFQQLPIEEDLFVDETNPSGYLKLGRNPSPDSLNQLITANKLSLETFSNQFTVAFLRGVVSNLGADGSLAAHRSLTSGEQKGLNLLVALHNEWIPGSTSMAKGDIAKFVREYWE